MDNAMCCQYGTNHSEVVSNSGPLQARKHKDVQAQDQRGGASYLHIPAEACCGLSHQRTNQQGRHFKRNNSQLYKAKLNQTYATSSPTSWQCCPQGAFPRSLNVVKLFCFGSDVNFVEHWRAALLTYENPQAEPDLKKHLFRKLNILEVLKKKLFLHHH